MMWPDQAAYATLTAGYPEETRIEIANRDKPYDSTSTKHYKGVHRHGQHHREGIKVN